MEINTIRILVSKTRRDKVRSADINKKFEIQDVINFTRKRTREWYNHFFRAGEDRLIKLARDSRPVRIRYSRRTLKKLI